MSFSYIALEVVLAHNENLFFVGVHDDSISL